MRKKKLPKLQVFGLHSLDDELFSPAPILFAIHKLQEISDMLVYSIISELNEKVV